MQRTECVVGERLWLAFVSSGSTNGGVSEPSLTQCEVAAVVDGRPVARRFVHGDIVGSAVYPVYDFEALFEGEREARIWLAGELTDRARRSLEAAQEIADAINKAAEEQIKLAMECEENVAAA